VSVRSREDAVLAVFEDMSESDTSNSESECDSEREVCESEVDAEEICDNFEIDSPENDARHATHKEEMDCRSFVSVAEGEFCS
jgi:hypothetical protein